MKIKIFFLIFPLSHDLSLDLFLPLLCRLLRQVRLVTDCRSNEVYFSCGNACELTCLNVTDQGKKLQPYVLLDQPCRYGCVGGCFCRGSLLRNRFGECVEEHQCNPVLSRDSLVQQLNQLLAADGSAEKTERPDTRGGEGGRGEGRRRSSKKDQLDSFLDDFNVDKAIDDHLDSLFNENTQHAGPNNVANNGKIDTKTEDDRPTSTDEIDAFIEKETARIIKRIHRGLR